MHMHRDATYRPSPPPPLPKQQNAVIRLYDAPLHRDWAFWNTTGWGLLAGISIPSTPPTEPSPLPLWLDTLLAIILMVVAFGVLPAWFRLLLRRLWCRWRRRGSVTHHTPSEHPATRGSAARLLESPRQEPPTASQPLASGDRPQPQWPSASGTGEGTAHHEGIDRTMLSAELLTHARNTLPHPIARAVRSLQQAHAPKEQYEALLDAAETLAITMCVSTAALLYEQDETPPIHGQVPGQRNLTSLRNTYFGSGAMFGTWTNWLKDLEPLASSHSYLTLGLSDALESKPGAPGILEHLRVLKKHRNRAAHGNKPKSQPESAVRVSECAPHFESLLTSAQYLTKYPWMFVISCAYQRRSRSFDVLAGHAMGDHPDFERRTFTFDHPVGNEVFYIIGPEGYPIPLTPFVANLFCQQCQQMEICYAYKVIKRENVAIYKSFGRGHEIRSLDLYEELHLLPRLRSPGNN